MPQVRVTETTVFKFDELTDQAKEKAREWWRDCQAQDNDTSCTFEDAATCAEILGIDLRTRSVKFMGGGTRMEPCIYYSGFWSQGDGACFEGSYQYAKGAAKKIRSHAPQDTELHRIADELQKIQRKYFYAVRAWMKHRGHYSHSGCMEVSVTAERDNTPSIEEAEEGVTQLMRDFADWIYDQLKKEWEWVNADEQVDESIRANEYEFSEDGAIV